MSQLIKGTQSIAGTILGYTAIGIDATADSYSTTTSMTVVDSDLKIVFVAPQSGNVEIFVSIYVDTFVGRNLIFGLSDASIYSGIDFPNSNDVTNHHRVYMGDETDEETLNHQWVITGLTPGSNHTWYLAAFAQFTADSYTLRWGGDATNLYGPFIMKATALPEKIVLV